MFKVHSQNGPANTVCDPQCTLLQIKYFLMYVLWGQEVLVLPSLFTQKDSKSLHYYIQPARLTSVILPALLQPNDFSSKYLPELLKNLTLTKENDQQNSDFQLSFCGSLRQSTEHNWCIILQPILPNPEHRSLNLSSEHHTNSSQSVYNNLVWLLAQRKVFSKSQVFQNHICCY